MAIPWTDEVFYADPGVGLALGKGFRSSDWCTPEEHEFWGLSNPGVSLLLAIWCKLFGVSAWLAHLFFATCFVTGWWLFSSWVKRWGDLPAGSQAFLMAYGLTTHAMSGNAMHHARPDAFWPLLLWLFLTASFGEGTKSRRATRLFSLGLLSAFFGLHFCAFFALGAVGVWLWRRNSESFVYGLWQALGMSIGLVALWLLYSAFGVWDDFIAHRSASAHATLDATYWIFSPDLFVITPLTLCLAFIGKDAQGAGLIRWMPFCMVLFVPLAIHFAGRYQAPYVWMVVAPAMLFALRFVRPNNIRLALLFAASTLLIFLGLAGRSRDLFKSVSDYSTRALAVDSLRKYVATDSGPVLVSVPLYYDVRSAGYGVVVAFNHRGSPELSLMGKVQWALLSEVDVPLIMPKVLGKWEEVRRMPARPISPTHGGFVLLRRMP